MPSSPEAAQLHAWVPSELAPVAVERPMFVATHPVAGPVVPAPFEVAGAAAVPDSLLAPARRRAEAAGYAAGWARGLAAARTAVETEAAATRARADADRVAAHAAVTQLLDSLTAAAAQVTAHRTQTLADAQDAVLDIAFGLLDSLVGSVLADDELRGRAVLARVLGDLPDTAAPVRLRVHPDDLLAAATLPGHVSVVADAALAPGDALAEIDSATVDAGLTAGLARVRQVLGR